MRSTLAADRLMKLDVVAKSGPEYGEESDKRLAQRNGYRDQDWQTRAGSVELRIRLARSSAAPTSSGPRHSFGPMAVMPSIPNEALIRRLVGAFLMEQTEQWTDQRGRYMTLKSTMMPQSACLLRSATDEIGPHQSARLNASYTVS